jgi:hypothetical protein
LTHLLPHHRQDSNIDDQSKEEICQEALQAQQGIHDDNDDNILSKQAKKEKRKTSKTIIQTVDKSLFLKSKKGSGDVLQHLSSHSRSGCWSTMVWQCKSICNLLLRGVFLARAEHLKHIASHVAAFCTLSKFPNVGRGMLMEDANAPL